MMVTHGPNSTKKEVIRLLTSPLAAPPSFFVPVLPIYISRYLFTIFGARRRLVGIVCCQCKIIEMNWFPNTDGFRPGANRKNPTKETERNSAKTNQKKPSQSKLNVILEIDARVDTEKDAGINDRQHYFVLGAMAVIIAAPTSDSYQK